jgi:hypothetical protein
VGPDGRAANSLKHKNFDDDNVIYLFFFPPFFFGGLWFGLVSFLLSFPRAKLYVLSRCEPVLIFVKKADYQFYQNLVEVLIPDVLKEIPGSFTSSIRSFAKSLENWLLTAMNGCPEDIIIVKV